MVNAIIICLQILILFEVVKLNLEKPKAQAKKEQNKADIFNKWMYGSEQKRK